VTADIKDKSPVELADMVANGTIDLDTPGGYEVIQRLAAAGITREDLDNWTTHDRAFDDCPF